MIHGIGKFHSEEPLLLESGRSLQSLDLAYETWGTLNDVRDNAILVCHGLTSDSHVAGGQGTSDVKPGWWEAAVGPGKPFDTEKYFILCSNALGGCGGSSGPSSVDKSTNSPFGLNFPVVTITDIVNAQTMLADSLGIQTFHTIAGGCFGGFQTLQWMCHHPNRLRNAIVISATPRTTAHNLGLWEVIRQAIMRDADFQGGSYYGGNGPVSGMGLAQMFGIMIWMDRKVMAQRFGLNMTHQHGPSYTLAPEFEFQAFLHKIGQNAINRFDPNSIIYLTKAMDYFDLTRDGKSLSGIFSNAGFKTLLIGYSTDWRYPPEEMAEIGKALCAKGLSVEFRVLDSDFGHGAFMYDSAGALGMIRDFMNSSE